MEGDGHLKSRPRESRYVGAVARVAAHPTPHEVVHDYLAESESDPGTLALVHLQLLVPGAGGRESRTWVV